jgi:MarR family transcriptional regulator, organic hydroperoxide resistance regulator
MPTQLNNDDEAVLRAEADIRARLEDIDLDFAALLAVSNVYRAATAIRNRMEREVLSGPGLSWGGFTILFVLWVWGPMEAHALADECGLAKGTLTGMVGTLESRGLVGRDRVDSDRRRVRIGLSESGRRLIADVFPRFNAEESKVVAGLDPDEIGHLSRFLRRVTATADETAELVTPPAVHP